MTLEKKECPCCDRHCPVENLHCGKGREYFGVENETQEGREGHGEGHGRYGEGHAEGRGRHSEGHGRHGSGHGEGHGGFRKMDKENMTKDEQVLMCMRRCGHYLQHNVSRGSETDSAQLLKALSEQEKEQLVQLLEKCISSWE